MVERESSGLSFSSYKDTNPILVAPLHDLIQTQSPPKGLASKYRHSGD